MSLVTTAGDLGVKAAVTTTHSLELVAAGRITENSTTGAVTTPDLSADAGTGISLTSTHNDIDTVSHAHTDSGTIKINTGTTIISHEIP